jgi:hypothetical protein
MTPFLTCDEGGGELGPHIARNLENFNLVRCLFSLLRVFHCANDHPIRASIYGCVAFPFVHSQVLHVVLILSYAGLVIFAYDAVMETHERLGQVGVSTHDLNDAVSGSKR